MDTGDERLTGSPGKMAVKDMRIHARAEVSIGVWLLEIRSIVRDLSETSCVVYLYIAKHRSTPTHTGV